MSTESAGLAFEITTSNSEDLPNVTRAIYVGGSGDIKVTTDGNKTVIFKGAQQGTILPIRVKKVFATGTDATFLVGLY